MQSATRLSQDRDHLKVMTKESPYEMPIYDCASYWALGRKFARTKGSVEASPKILPQRRENIALGGTGE